MLAHVCALELLEKGKGQKESDMTYSLIVNTIDVLKGY